MTQVQQDGTKMFSSWFNMLECDMSYGIILLVLKAPNGEG